MSAAVKQAPDASTRFDSLINHSQRRRQYRPHHAPSHPEAIDLIRWRKEPGLNKNNQVNQNISKKVLTAACDFGIPWPGWRGPTHNRKSSPLPDARLQGGPIDGVCAALACLSSVEAV